MKHSLNFTVVVINVFILAAVLSLGLFSQQDQERIVEEVSVNWWQVPVFAVDKAGNPVTDLEAGDIEVRLNGQSVPAFTLNKREFDVTEIKAGATAEKPAAAPPPPLLKEKAVFLLFDLALSSEASTTEAKKIAKKIIMDTKEDTHFFIMKIDAFAGLLYVAEWPVSSCIYP